MYFANALYERRNHNAAGVSLTGLNATQQTATKKQHVKDLNIDDRISLFKDKLKNEYVYIIPLRYFSDVGKINFPRKIDYRIKLFLETDMERLFEYRKALAANTTILAVDAEIIFTRAPFTQYEQILLDKNFRQEYFSGEYKTKRKKKKKTKRRCVSHWTTSFFCWTSIR